MRLVLAKHDGDTELDRRIARRQEQIRQAREPVPHLERLGHLFVAKARTTSDPGYYKLAEVCAQCIEDRSSDSPSVLLLRGHVLHSLHHFGEAEAVARRLVEMRGNFLDQGLLGDVLVDLGHLEGARECYQRMLDLKPCLQSYSRAAHLRWLRGDLDDARRLLRLATHAGSRRDPEPLCWVHARLATLELQAGDLEAARAAALPAAEILPGYAPALLALGRIRMAAGDPTGAVAMLQQAAGQNPLPEYQWALSEALRMAGRVAEAERVEETLSRTGGDNDPRTLAIYLASSGRDPARALALAERELEVRQDVHTHDAHAWALLANGRPEQADRAAVRALAEGTADARLLYHAGVIATANGNRTRARDLLTKAEAMRSTLLPSEQRRLLEHLAEL